MMNISFTATALSMAKRFSSRLVGIPEKCANMRYHSMWIKRIYCNFVAVKTVNIYSLRKLKPNLRKETPIFILWHRGDIQALIGGL